MQPRGVCRRVLKPRTVWEGPLGTSCCCQPDSGKPTVRDERGAHGDVDYGGIRNPLLVSKERRSDTLHLRLHAPCFYPTLLPNELLENQGVTTGVFQEDQR